MRYVKCPVCGNIVPSKAELCPVCEAKFEDFKNKKNHKIIKCLSVLIVLFLGFNITQIIIQNNKIRDYMENPPNDIKEIEALEASWERLNFIQKKFVRNTEIEYLKNKFNKTPEVENVYEMPVTIIFEERSREGIYTGELLDGYPNGTGKFEYYGDNNIAYSYEGEFKDGVISGMGVMVCEAGQIYEGKFNYGKLNGEGKITDPNQNPISEGKYINNLLNGQGTLYHDNGKVIYSGEFHQNLPDLFKYTNSCIGVDYDVLKTSAHIYNDTNVFVKGILVDILEKENGKIQYLIQESVGDNTFVCVEHPDTSVLLELGCEIGVYGFCKGATSFVDSLDVRRNGLGIISFFIDKI